MSRKLVNYSDSDSEEDNQKNVPTLPDFIYDTRDKRPQVVPSSSGGHQGRKRRKEHVHGSFNTHIFISFRIPECLNELMDKCKKALKQTFPDENVIHEISTEFLHISLSRDLYLKEYQFRPFLDKLEQRVVLFRKFQLRFDPTITGYKNDEGTRHFIAMDVHKQYQDSLLNIIAQVNDIVESFGQSRFYVEPKFHASFLWSLHKHADIISPKILSNVNKELEADPTLLQKLKQFTVNVDCIECKIRNQVYKIPLQN